MPRVLVIDLCPTPSEVEDMFRFTLDEIVAFARLGSLLAREALCWIADGRASFSDEAQERAADEIADLPMLREVA